MRFFIKKRKYTKIATRNYLMAFEMYNILRYSVINKG